MRRKLRRRESDRPCRREYIDVFESDHFRGFFPLLGSRRYRDTATRSNTGPCYTDPSMVRA